MQNTQRGEIGRRVFQLMEERKVSQVELSKGTGIPIGTISDWSRKGTNPSSDKLMCICRYFGVSAKWLLVGKNESLSQNRIGNVTRGMFVQGVNNGMLIGETDGKQAMLSPEEQELLRIYSAVDVKKRIRLVNFALELEENKA